VSYIQDNPNRSCVMSAQIKDAYSRTIFVESSRDSVVITMKNGDQTTSILLDAGDSEVLVTMLKEAIKKIALY